MLVDELSGVEEGYTINRAICMMDNALNGVPTLFEWKARRKDGTTFWCQVSLKLLRSDEEKFLIAVVRNVSETKKGY